MSAAPGSETSRWHRLRRALSGEGVGAILARGASGTASVQLIGLPLLLGVHLALTRQLGVTQYGYYAFAFGCAMLLAVVCRLGLEGGITRYTAAYRVQGEGRALRGLALRGTQAVAGVSVALGLVLALGALLLQERLPADQVWTLVVAGAALPPLALLGIERGLLRGARRPAKAMLLQRVLLPGCTLLLLVAWASTAGLARAPMAMTLTLGGALTVIALGAFWVRGALADTITGVGADYRTREWLRASLPMLLTSSMLMTMNHVDTIMLGLIAGTDASGLYYPAARISEVAAIGLACTNVVVAPMISELHTTDQRARLQRLLTLAAIVTSAITLAVATALWLAGEWVLGFFGAAFTASYPALMILLGGQLVNALCGPVGMMMNMTGHQDRAALVISSAAALNVGLNATLIPLYGITGAAIATAISAATWNLWMFAEVRRHHGLNPSVFTRWPSLWKASTPH